MRVPINDLARHNHAISRDVEGAIDRVLTRGWYILGPELKAFEEEYAEYCCVRYCIGVGNGTDALELALRALDVLPGDEIAAVANAGMYATTAIRAVGAEPLYVDVDPRSMTMSPECLISALTRRTRAIIVTHLYGRMANMPQLMTVATRAGIPVVEDCAQAHGARMDGRSAGSWGTIGCFSFYPTKNLGALGDAGALVTNEPELASRITSLRQYGWTTKYHSSLPNGRNSRMDEIQAAILRSKLPYLDDWNERRRDIARSYSGALGNLGLTLPDAFGPDYVAHLYVVRTPRRNELRAVLTEAGIGTEIHYPVPDHQQRLGRLHYSDCWTLPETERCSREVLSLPCFPELSGEEIEMVLEAVRDACRR